MVFIYSIALLAFHASNEYSVRGLQNDWRSFIDPEILNRDLNKDYGSRFSDGVFEGDIAGVLQDSAVSELRSNARNVMNGETSRWPNGIVPFRFKPNSFVSREVEFIKRTMAMSVLTRNCIRFVEQTDQTDHILFIRGLGCFSSIGRGGGQQKISLTRGCLENMGDAQHELMHALGFYHEMTRTDRDQYITINWDNISEDDKNQFTMYTDGKTFRLPYDYESVMHYPFNAFALDKGAPTIVPKIKHSRIGQNKNLSPLDVLKIQRAYKCDPIPDPMLLEGDSMSSTSSGPEMTQTESECNNVVKLMPAFLFKPITVDECRSFNIGSCRNIAADSGYCSDDAIISIKCPSGTVEELIAISSIIKILDKSRPVQFVNLDRQTVSEVFSPIRKMIISLHIELCLNPLSTSKLPNLKIPNLIFFQLTDCDAMVIHKEDFANNLRLREIDFERVTIESIETGTFSNLPELQYLSLELYWKRPFSAAFVAHLLRLHCDCQYSWLGRWLKQNPILISPKRKYEVTRFGNFGNIDVTRAETFVPVDCSNKDLNDVIFDDSQLSYSVNDLC